MAHDLAKGGVVDRATAERIGASIGHGGCTIPEAALDTARLFWLVPCAHGGVQLELHTKDSHVEIEINRHGEVEAVMWSRT